MDDARIDEITGRLDLLEREDTRRKESFERLRKENRLLRRVGAVGVLSAAVLIAAGARSENQPKVLQGERLVLQGEDGKPSIAMGRGPDGDPTLTFYKKREGTEAHMSMRMFVAEDGIPVLLFGDQTGQIRYRIPR
jgi:hypothetical protein